MNPDETPGPTLVIGLLGGIAAGKSWVATALTEHGFRVIDADAEARTVTSDPAILDSIGARFGRELVADGLDRTALAELVFEDPVARKDLEAITHPAVRKRILAGLEAARVAGQAVVLDVPLLLEGGLIEKCDESIFLQVSEDIRQARAATRGWDTGELARREAAQAPLAEKRARCRFVVVNEADADETRAQVAAIVAELNAERDAGREGDF